VIIDAVNGVEPARDQWRRLAHRRRVPLSFIEVVCSDLDLHRQRLERRRREIEGFYEPTWASVEARRAGFDNWREDRLILDSTKSRSGNLATALAHLQGTC